MEAGEAIFYLMALKGHGGGVRGPNEGSDTVSVSSRARVTVLCTVVRGTDEPSSPTWPGEQPGQTRIGTPCHGGAVTGSVKKAEV